MHNAGAFGTKLYDSLKEVCKDTPSLHYVEELLRIAGLLHDVGHGPYGHFFDDHFLCQYGLTHEDISQHIIVRKLGALIRGITRSPSGPFDPGEVLDPNQVAFLIHVPREDESGRPKWLKLLRQLFTGIYTVDNLDYVQRDAYMTGFSLDLVDTKRLLHYTFYSPDGLTLHQAGISALNRFLNARLNLYTNVYFHRTTRALDLHLQEIFRETMDLILPGNPLLDMDRYLGCDEWLLFHATQNWFIDSDTRKRRLGREWKKLFQRQVKWKMSFSTEISVDQVQRGTRFAPALDYEKEIRTFLPSSLKSVRFRVDLATQDPRPLNPLAESGKRIFIFNPVTGKTSPEPLKDIYRFIPARVVHFRVFSITHRDDEILSKAAEQSLTALEDVSRTNI